MVKDDPCFWALSHQLKPGNRKDAFGPGDNPPGLDNLAVGYQLQISSHDMTGEDRKSAPDGAVDGGRPPAGKCCELLGVQEGFVNAMGNCFEIFFLMDRFRCNDCLRCWLKRSVLGVGIGAKYRQTTKPDGTPSDHFPPRR